MKVAVRWATDDELNAMPEDDILPDSYAAVVSCKHGSAIYWLIHVVSSDLADETRHIMLIDFDSDKFEATAGVFDAVARFAQGVWDLPFAVRFARSDISMASELRNRGFRLSSAPHDIDFWEWQKPATETC